MNESSIRLIESEVRRAIHRGAVNAHGLYYHLPKLLDLLSPAVEETRNCKDTADRALAAEELILAAVATIGENDNVTAEALLILLGLKHNPTFKNTPTLGRGLQKRREEASRYLDISVETFRKNYEKEMLSALAFEIWRIQRNKQNPCAV